MPANHFLAKVERVSKRSLLDLYTPIEPPGRLNVMDISWMSLMEADHVADRGEAPSLPKIYPRLPRLRKPEGIPQSRRLRVQVIGFRNRWHNVHLSNIQPTWMNRIVWSGRREARSAVYYEPAPENSHHRNWTVAIA